MDINKTRLNNLKILISETNTINELAEKANTAASYLSQLKTGMKTAKGKPKKIGDELARKLEKATNKTQFWMDQVHLGYVHTDQTYHTSIKNPAEMHQIMEHPAEYNIIPTVPLISWEQAGGVIIDNLPTKTAEKQIPTSKPFSTTSFALTVKSDSIANHYDNNLIIQHGSIIIVDPEKQPENGNIVVASFGESEQSTTLKKYVLDPPNKYLEALNPKYEPILITQDCKIIGVVTEVITTLT